jgi:hypothetical protein
MKGSVPFVIVALLAAAVGLACLIVGLYDRDMARADQLAAVGDYAGAAKALHEAERYLAYASIVPAASGPLNRVRAREASLHYWQRDFATIVPNRSDPIGPLPADNIDLQFVAANAAYRLLQAGAKDRTSTLAAIDGGISAYNAVLKNAGRHNEAAYNVEYLVRLRDDVDKGRRKPGFAEPLMTELGSLGFPAKDIENTAGFKVLIPLDSEERNKVGNAGKATPKPRKG